MTNPFAPTHEIVVTSTAGFLTGVVKRIPVLRDGDVLYTRTEWEGETSADWSLPDGELRWQGQAAGLYAPGHTVEIRPISPDHVAEATGTAWGKEMVEQGARAETGADDAQRVSDLENCDFGALADDLRAAGYGDPCYRDDWRHLVTLCCRAALAYVKEHGERDEDAA